MMSMQEEFKQEEEKKRQGTKTRDNQTGRMHMSWTFESVAGLESISFKGAPPL